MSGLVVAYGEPHRSLLESAFNKGGRCESAGKSRHGVGGEASTETCRRAHVESLSRSQVHYRVRSSDPLWPRAMRRRPVMVRLRRSAIAQVPVQLPGVRGLQHVHTLHVPKPASGS